MIWPLSHVWTAPLAQGFSEWRAPVGCIHVSGLSAQRVMAAGPDEVRRSKPWSGQRARGALLPWVCSIPGLTGFLSTS